MLKSKVNPQKVVIKILKFLPERNQDIISRRFGLNSDKKETLESIGKSYKITRERVRQVEEAALAQLRKELVKLSAETSPYLNLAEAILQEHGGALKEETFFEQFSGMGVSTPANAALTLLVSLDGRFCKNKETDIFYAFWSLGDSYGEKAKEAVSNFINILKKQTRPITDADLNDLYKKETKVQVSAGVLSSYISLSKEISKNVFNELGLSDWPEINPRGAKDKAYLVLKRANEPKHFFEIAKLINVAGFDGKKVNVQTVHNELIKDKRFVLVGRGIYGLAKWGYKSGTVEDVLEDILRKSKAPLSRSEIVARVLAARFVKENTIFLNLQDSKKFKKLSDGKYSLNEV